MQSILLIRKGEWQLLQEVADCRGSCPHLPTMALSASRGSSVGSVQNHEVITAGGERAGKGRARLAVSFGPGCGAPCGRTGAPARRAHLRVSARVFPSRSFNKPGLGTLGVKRWQAVSVYHLRLINWPLRKRRAKEPEPRVAGRRCASLQPPGPPPHTAQGRRRAPSPHHFLLG